MNMGKLQQRFYDEKPAVYDREKKTAYLCVTEAEQSDMTAAQPLQTERLSQAETEDGTSAATATRRGWAAYPVELDGLMDYGHIKSQLVEAAFAPKDEFGFAINAIGVLVGIVLDGKNKEEYADVIAETKGFLEYRDLCAKTAKEIISSVNA